MKNTKGFTIVELIISMFLTTMILSGLVVFLSGTIVSSNGLSNKSETFFSYENFKETLDEYAKDYPAVVLAGNTPFTNKSGFDFVLLMNHNVAPTAGVLIGVYDNIASEVVYGEKTYGEYYPFFIKLDNAEVNQAKGDLAGYINYIDLQKINYSNGLLLTKMGANMFEGHLKMDFNITPLYYSDLAGYKIDSLYENDQTSIYNISLLK